MENKIICGSADLFLERCQFQRCIFADIPDNIGLPYVGVSDERPLKEYMNWCYEIIWRSLCKSEIFWLSFNANYMLWMSQLITRAMTDVKRAFNHRYIIWRYNFGQYRDDRLTSGYRPIALLVEVGAQLNFDAIRVKSYRMKIDDLRSSGLRVPDDVWDFPRIVGSSKERRDWHPTQHPETLMERIVLLSCTETTAGRTRPIGTFVDLCLGSGTSGVVCNRLGIPWVGVELSESYCRRVSTLTGAKFTQLQFM